LQHSARIDSNDPPRGSSLLSGAGEVTVHEAVQRLVRPPLTAAYD
jgi:hypothetical protein